MVERTAVVERGARLYGPCVVLGKSRICAGAAVYPFSFIQDSSVGKNTLIRSSTLICATVGADCTVGPYAYLREFARVGDNCRIGDFVEIKNSTTGDGTKAAHLAYIGDAELGRAVNVGCGVVFANYDGANKRRSRVGDGCFIGCNCNIVAPVNIGDGAYIAAGTTLTRDLAADDFCIGRCREKITPCGAEGRYKNGQIFRN